jgi:alpha-tubulin suppressor-like RCC1 family protein
VVAGGAVWCWGGNDRGQLGLGTRDPWLVPAAVAGQGSVTTAIAAGSEFTCSRRDDGTVWCWGRGDAGQMGQASPNDSLTPFPIATIANATAIATGGAHACARIASGALRCWGDNGEGALGDTTLVSRSRPEPVEGIGNAQAVAAGAEHTCAIRAGGQLWCWGDNGDGALGDGAANSAAIPVVVARPEPDLTGLAVVEQLSLGDQSSCLINASRRLECWGGNRFGVLGDGSESQRLEVSFIAYTVQVHSSRGDHACSITSDQTGISGGGSVGIARCWGLNFFGQLGDGTQVTRPTPAPITGAGSTGQVTAIAAGHGHTCLVHGGGERACTGYNEVGSACQGDLLDRTSFENCAAVTATTVALAAGGDHTCALTGSGAVRCWGWNARGQLGNGSQAFTALPAGVSGLGNGNLAVAAGTSHTCALNAARGVVCWGSNQSGQLGNGSLVDSSVPVPVSGLAGDVQALALGSDFSCALTVSGAVFCWGGNGSNQLGDGTSERRLVPTPVSGLGTGATRIGAGSQHACAVVGGSEIRCWGSNLLGQLGTGTARLRAWPAPVLRLDALFADGFE